MAVKRHNLRWYGRSQDNGKMTNVVRITFILNSNYKEHTFYMVSNYLLKNNYIRLPQKKAMLLQTPLSKKMFEFRKDLRSRTKTFLS